MLRCSATKALLTFLPAPPWLCRSEGKGCTCKGKKLAYSVAWDYCNRRRARSMSLCCAWTMTCAYTPSL